MKSFFCVGSTVLMLGLFSLFCQESAAQYRQAPQAPQGNAQPRSVYATAPQTNATANDPQAAKIEANLARLSPEDRQVAEAQGYCPIMVKNRLGVMGPPVKVMVKGQPVFVCCKGCAAKAMANPDRTLANVAALKARSADAEINASLSKLSPEDRKLAEAQGYCPIMTDNRLGVMGPPVKIIIGTQPVFLCCKGCRTRALSNPERTLAIVDQLKARVSQAAARSAATVQPNATQR